MIADIGGADDAVSAERVLVLERGEQRLPVQRSAVGYGSREAGRPRSA